MQNSSKIFTTILNKNLKQKKDFVSNMILNIIYSLADRDWMAKNTQEKEQTFNVSISKIFNFMNFLEFQRAC